CSGPEVVDEHVRFGEQIPQYTLPVLRRQVESDGFLAPVQPGEMRGEPAADGRVVLTREVAAVNAFHLDDLGAEVGEVSCRERNRHRLLESDDANAIEGSHRASSSGSPATRRTIRPLERCSSMSRCASRTSSSGSTRLLSTESSPAATRLMTSWSSSFVHDLVPRREISFITRWAIRTCDGCPLTLPMRTTRPPVRTACSDWASVGSPAISRTRSAPIPPVNSFT